MNKEENMSVKQFKLVVLYDRDRNEYSISAHNKGAEEAQQFMERWNPQLMSGCTLMVLDHSKRHGTAEARDCEACRKVVRRSGHLEPHAKYIRRQA